MSDLSDAAAMYAKQCAKQREEIDRLRAANAKLTDDVTGCSNAIRMLTEANARLQAECDRKQEWIDAVMGQDDAAHIMPSDLERFAGSETFAQCYSVAVGNPDENSVPLITRPQPLAKE